MKTILIQEADDSIREVLSLILEQEGYRICAFGHGSADTPYLIAQINPSLALVDFNLSVESSISLCRRIKNLLPRLPVIAMSCNANIKNLYQRYGFNAYLEKPFELTVLLSTVRQYILPDDMPTATKKEIYPDF